MGDISAVVLDIEGTVTPISFVHETLFGYIRRELKKFLTETWESKETVESVNSLRTETEKLNVERKEGKLPTILPESSPKEELLNSTYDNVIGLMDLDLKVTPLKLLQARIMESGFKSKEIIANIYQDGIDSIRKWNELKVPVYIYSSGSISAQKTLFSHTKEGDLLPLLKGHFDTTIGSKLDDTSYTKISKEINIDPSKILFLTDNHNEAVASRKAGINCIIADRPGNNPLPKDNDFPVISNFNVLFYKFSN
eukprot:TRINITY_DN17293_c0_g1_i1.p1 TRINITY_DN17293_c0_g1~~TRINITY_DN17293_c0_g1_i1.p1  ORF type:complete len:253 (+),score=65.00 TRINITY_DN17293_c0_g1_i1:22-780(+)